VSAIPPGANATIRRIGLAEKAAAPVPERGRRGYDAMKP